MKLTSRQVSFLKGLAHEKKAVILLGKNRQDPLGHFITTATDADQCDRLATVFFEDRAGKALVVVTNQLCFKEKLASDGMITHCFYFLYIRDDELRSDFCIALHSL